jgi:TANFOR domain-containing protein
MQDISKLTRLIILMLLLAMPVYGFAQVNVTIQILPPYYTQITDYASHPSQILVTITNLTTTTQNIQLRGTVSGDNGISITTNAAYKSRAPIVLNANATRVMTGNDIPAFFDYSLLSRGLAVLSGYTKQDFVRNGGFPEGNYRFCLQAFDYNTDAPLSVGQPVGCSNSVSTTSFEPPTIISPYNRQEVSTNSNNIVVINWSTPAGAPPSTYYHLRMVEMRGTSEDPNIAFATGRLFFDKNNIMTNTYVYNPSDPRLNSGKKYAVMVQAVDPNTSVNFKNQGKSVIYSFSYVAPLVVYDNPVLVAPGNNEQINATNIQPAKFTIKWTKPLGLPDNIRSKLMIVQVPDGQSAADVMANPKPPFFLNYEASNTYSYDYDISRGSPAMISGKTYAVVVQFIDPQNTVKFKNGGKSEVISFIYVKRNRPNQL